MRVQTARLLLVTCQAALCSPRLTPAVLLQRSGCVSPAQELLVLIPLLRPVTSMFPFGSDTDASGNQADIVLGGTNNGSRTAIIRKGSYASTGIDNRPLEFYASANSNNNSKQPIEFYNWNSNDGHAVKIDELGRVLINHTSYHTASNTNIPILQTSQNSASRSAMFSHWQNTPNGPKIYLAKSRNSNIGTHVWPQLNDKLGEILFCGSDEASGTFEPGAVIRSQAVAGWSETSRAHK